MPVKNLAKWKLSPLQGYNSHASLLPKRSFKPMASTESSPPYNSPLTKQLIIILKLLLPKLSVKKMEDKQKRITKGENMYLKGTKSQMYPKNSLPEEDIIIELVIIMEIRWSSFIVLRNTSFSVRPKRLSKV